MPEPTEPAAPEAETPAAGNVIHVDLDIDLDKALVGRRTGIAYDADGEPYEYQTGPRQVTLEDLVLDAVVDDLVKHATSDRDFLSGQQSRVSKIRDDVLREKLEPILTEAIAKAVQPTNRMGEGACDPVTLSDIILERGKAWLEERVSTRDHRRQVTRIQSMIDEAVDRTFRQELQAAIDAGKTEIKKALREQAASLLADTLARYAENAAG